MHRIDSITAAPDLHGAGKDGFTEGDPLGGVAPTELTADFFNAVQEELAGTVEHVGDLVKADNGQLLQAVLAMVALTALRNTVARDVNGYGLFFYGAGGEGQDLVAVGAGGEIQTSSDGGESWVQRAAANAYGGAFRAAAITPAGLMCAVGDVGEIQTSSDGGATWVHRAPAGSYAGNWRGVVATPTGRLVAVGTAGEFQYSDDGVTWSRPTSPFGGEDLFAVACTAGGVLCAVGDNGKIGTSTTNGLTWQIRAAAGAFAGGFYAVTALGELLIALGSAGEIQTSSDGGATWVHRSAAGAYAGSWEAVAARNDGSRPYALAAGWTGELQVTFDGVRWHRLAPDVAHSIYAVAPDGRGGIVLAGAGLRTTLRVA